MGSEVFRFARLTSPARAEDFAGFVTVMAVHENINRFLSLWAEYSRLSHRRGKYPDSTQT
jgi:hypothetical protein